MWDDQVEIIKLKVHFYGLMVEIVIHLPNAFNDFEIH